MAFIPIEFQPDIDYTGTYTVKIYNVGGSTAIASKTYSSPYSGLISDILTLPVLKSYDIKIFADSCNKLIDSETLTVPYFCDQVRNLTRNTITDEGATISWLIPSNGTPAAGYLIEIYTGSILIDSISTSATSYILTGLDAETAYTIKVYSKCSATVLSSSKSTTFTTTD